MAPDYTFRFVQIEGLSERVDSSPLVFGIDWEIGHSTVAFRIQRWCRLRCRKLSKCWAF